VELFKDVSRSSEGTAVETAADPKSAVELGDADAAMLRSEGERLKLERDVAQLRAELAQINRPWWRKGSIVATMTAIIAAVVPITTAVQQHYQKEREMAAAQSQKERELALQAAKQDHEIRTSYLDRLEKPGAKLRTLRFVEATTSDPAMKAWAQAEAKVVQTERSRPLEAADDDRMGLRAGYARDRNAKTRRRQSAATGFAICRDAALSRRSVLRSRAVGRPLDAGGSRIGSRGP